MKANHNEGIVTALSSIVVVNLTNWQNESKSQLTSDSTFEEIVVVNLTNWQNESKSQR